MKTVGIRELKRHPGAVLRRVLESGEEYEITAHGRPTWGEDQPCYSGEEPMGQG